MYETLKIEKVDGHAVLTLNRPEALNALSPQLLREVATAFAEFQADPAVQVVILTGAGRAFCAGLDTKHLAQSGTNAFDLKTFDLPEIIEQFPGPVIAAINGLAFTGGFEIALACDVIIAAESASLVDGHSRVGLMPGWGLSQRLPRTIGLYRAKELTLTGRALSGRQAEAWGLASRCVPDGELMQVARDMAKAMIAGSPGMLPPLKAVMNEGSRTTLGEALVLENRKARVINRALRPDQLQFKRTASDANSQP